MEYTVYVNGTGGNYTVWADSTEEAEQKAIDLAYEYGEFRAELAAMRERMARLENRLSDAG